MYKQKTDTKEALNIWEYIIKNEPDSTYAYGMSINNLHQHYASEHNLPKCKEYFNRIISSKLNDEHQTVWIMEPYTNYRHNACITMFQLYASIDSFGNSIEYLKLAKNKFKYVNSSGTSLKNKEIELIIWESRLNYDLGNKEKTEQILIDAGMKTIMSNPIRNDKAVKNKYTTSLISELSNTFTLEELRPMCKEINHGLENMKLESDGNIIIKYGIDIIQLSTTKFLTAENYSKVIKESYFIDEMKKICE